LFYRMLLLFVPGVVL